MIFDASSVDDLPMLSADLVVVGAGPAGIVLALEAARRGCDVLLLESGGESFRPEAQQLSEAAEWDHDLHAPMSLAVRRQIGGTSVIWGGRCVPYDPVDFEERPASGGAQWPVTYDELTKYFERACDWLACGRAVFDAEQIPHLPEAVIPGLANAEVRTSNLERWSLPTNFGSEYGDRLRRSRQIRVITGLTCTRIVAEPEAQARVGHLECRTLNGGRLQVRGKQYAIACGGLETTRLLLASTGAHDRAMGDHSGHLGRWYMGHAEGVIANVRFSTPPRSTIFDYERDIDGVYVRRRFSFSRDFQIQQGLPNIVAWLANPGLADARHHSGPLSFVYLTLASPLGRHLAPDAQRLSLTGHDVPGAPYGPVEPSPVRDHLRNMASDVSGTARFVAGFGARRFLARRRKSPGFFTYSRENCYPLQYHGEHQPYRQSRVTLAEDRDALGMPKLRIDLRFTDEDVDGVLRAHRSWDDYLRRSGRGQLEFLDDDPGAAVWRRIGGGFHQVGTTRMSTRPSDGVVDGDLRVHGMENLYVAGSSTFVTSGQANSTFMIVVFALRLADHLSSILRTRR